jgi:Zn-finger nucleic acid-binding protein
MSDDVLIACPKCDEVLDRLSSGGVEVDICESCGGIWLDRGELAKLKIRANTEDLAQLAQRASGGRVVPPTSARIKLPCPVCEGVLLPLQIGQVAIDRCQSCQGLWLDRGELEAALAALESEIDPAILDALMGLITERS